MPARIGYHRAPTSPTVVTTHRPPTPVRRQEDKNFYARAAWRRTRDAKLRVSPLCEGDGCIARASHVHHVQPRKDRPDLAFDLENLRALCQPCHNREEVR